MRFLDDLSRKIMIRKQNNKSMKNINEKREVGTITLIFPI